MPINLYNGLSIFGRAVKMRPDLDDRREQENFYPGLTGVEFLDMGGGGRVNQIRGRLFAADEPSLWLARILLESYADGVPRPLWDSLGGLWQNVVLISPKFPGDPTSDANGWTWGYTMTARHLTPS